ncbi:HU family DNA-binding protein [bacterium]|nr:HU family DNA-binding protein [bacterium]
MNDKITFSDLVKQIAEETDASEQKVHDLLIEMIGLSKEELDKDGLAILPGLGRLKLKWHEERMGRNPQTGEELTIPAHNSINFSPESNLRKFINRKYAHLRPVILEDEQVNIPDDIVPEDVPIVENEHIEEPSAIQEEKEEKKDKSKWLWLLLIPVIVILFIIFWPHSDSDTKKDASADTISEISQDTEQIPEQLTEEPVTETKAVDTEIEESEKKETVVEEVVKESVPGLAGGQHKIDAGESLWSISEKFYQRNEYWPNIYRVNRNMMPHPDFLLPGNTITVPPFEGTSDNLTKKDKDDLSDGYIEAYIAYKKLGRTNALYYLWTVRNWQDDAYFKKYSDQIDSVDLDRVDNINGIPQFD